MFWFKYFRKYIVACLNKLCAVCCADIEDVEKHMPGFLRVSYSCVFTDVPLSFSLSLCVCASVFVIRYIFTMFTSYLVGCSMT